jgi:hypothetical protein
MEAGRPGITGKEIMNKPIIKIIDKTMHVGDVEIPLLSGEVHYWRLDPERWLQVLRRVREMGLNVIATYACWDFHELEPGKFDFTGRTDPHRNLVSFLELLRSEGFWVIFRPGPYIYSEWHNNGVPDYAARYHRLDPAFQAAALPYMQAVTDVALPFLASKGGNIILWQADNEIDPWSHWYTEQLGLGNTAGLFQEFLKTRYSEIQRLNQAWDVKYTNFEEARAVTALFHSEPSLISRYLDYVRFEHDYVTKVAKWAVGVYRQLGVDMPMYLNTYSGVSTQPWNELEAVGDLSGPDIYPSNELDGRPNEHRALLEAVRYTRTYSKLPYIPEFEAGIWHDWLPEVDVLTPNHYRLICLSALQAGAAGWNWYMLVDRDNWYQSPINPWGRTRPDLFAAFKDIVSLYNEVHPKDLVKLTSTAVTFDSLQRASIRPGQELLQAFYDADVDYEFFDLDHGSCSKPIAFYAGGNWLSANGQKRLQAFVIEGGHLVCMGAFPYLDDAMQSLNLLNIIPAAGIIKGMPQLGLELSLGVSVNTPWIYTYAEVPGETITARRATPAGLTMEENALQWGLQNGNQYTIGYTQPVGKGRLTMLGVQPSASLVLAVHHHFNIPICSRSLDEHVKTALFEDHEGFIIIATNNSKEARTAQVEFDPEFAKGQWESFNLSTGRNEVEPFLVSVAGKDGTILQIRRSQK